MPPPSTAPSRPRGSTRTKVDWSHLLEDSDDDDNVNEFDWYV